ncbi:hypothetical protein C8R46DRAFT_1124750 [Mycena filopes]|nr:hypothetical protein C8R46DRAFT_1124750 [Mycena filopes]
MSTVTGVYPGSIFPVHSGRNSPHLPAFTPQDNGSRTLVPDQPQRLYADGPASGQTDTLETAFPSKKAKPGKRRAGKLTTSENLTAPASTTHEDGDSTPASTARECSVRGCSKPLGPPGPDPLVERKMCASCRQKHRGYASTKRARRKAEKALSQSNPAPATPTSPSSSSQPTPNIQKSTWPIDPALYSQPSAQSSSLAGALTLQPTTISNPSVSLTAPSASALASRDQQRLLAPRSPELPKPPQSNPPTPGIHPPPPPVSAIHAAVEAAPQPSDGESRFCSVKGCNAAILESTEIYPYKMCRPCRTRYRDYGITKRAKQKAERQAEMDALRVQENLRRAENGLPPLIEENLKRGRKRRKSRAKEKVEAASGLADDTVRVGATEGNTVRVGATVGTSGAVQLAQRRSKPPGTCREDDCCNLILPGVRWRSCDSCRTIARVLRQNKEAELNQLNFVNLTVNVHDYNAWPPIPEAGDHSPSGPSAVVVTPASDSRPNIAATASAYHPPNVPAPPLPTYPSGPASTFATNEPGGKAADPVNPPVVRGVRRYRKLPRYDKDGNLIPNGTNAHASSSTVRLPAPSSTPSTLPPSTLSTMPPSTLPTMPPSTLPTMPHQSIPGHYPYPSPPPAIQYYMPPPGYGYYGMPPTGSAVPGQPPPGFMYIPTPYPYPTPPTNSAGTGASVPVAPYPYYPYALPPVGYGLPHNYPGHPPGTAPAYAGVSAGRYQSPYAAYQPSSSAPPVVPPPFTSPPGYIHHQEMRNPARESDQPSKRRRLSEETPAPAVAASIGTVAAPAMDALYPPADTSVPAPPADTPAMDVETSNDAPQTPPTPRRLCGIKKCNRQLPSGKPATMCEKCRTKMKRRQAAKKQRFRLEPKTSIVAKSS